MLRLPSLKPRLCFLIFPTPIYYSPVRLGSPDSDLFAIPSHIGLRFDPFGIISVCP